MEYVYLEQTSLFKYNFFQESSVKENASIAYYLSTCNLYYLSKIKVWHFSGEKSASTTGTKKKVLLCQKYMLKVHGYHEKKFSRLVVSFCTVYY